MHIEVNGDVERLIQAGLATGQFHSAEEAIAAMAHAWANSNQRRNQTPTIPAVTDIRQFAIQQGVKPFSASVPQPDFWPSEESSEEFLEFFNVLT